MENLTPKELLKAREGEKTEGNVFVWMDDRTRKNEKEKIKISLEQERTGHIQKEHVT